MEKNSDQAYIINKCRKSEYLKRNIGLYHGDVSNYLDSIPNGNHFDLVLTSPPYNIGKEYEVKTSLDEYIFNQEKVIAKIADKMSDDGSICWQVGNYISKGEITPLDMMFHPIFKKLGFVLRNRIIWRFGHGLHCKNRFSGRYEVILWYTKSNNYTFNLDEVRIPSKYPGKRHFKGPNIGKLSGNPLGKNPEDVWDIPNVKGSHIEKADHPCQFPVGLAQRLILSLSNKGDRVFDPYAGVCSSGVAAAITGRKFLGCDIEKYYLKQGQERINSVLKGSKLYRPHDKEIVTYPDYKPQSIVKKIVWN